MPVMQCDLLVIGAGPYGIATAAYAKSCGLDVVVCGRFMEFWKRSMPDGMFLRSDERWHLDAEERHTFKAFVNEAGFSREQIRPLPISVFLEYSHWFRDRKEIEIRDVYVTELFGSAGAFTAKPDSADAVEAKRVVVAPGYRYFRNFPADVVGLLPEGSFRHSSAGQSKPAAGVSNPACGRESGRGTSKFAKKLYSKVQTDQVAASRSVSTTERKLRLITLCSQPGMRLRFQGSRFCRNDCRDGIQFGLRLYKRVSDGGSNSGRQRLLIV